MHLLEKIKKERMKLGKIQQGKAPKAEKIIKLGVEIYEKEN